MAYMHGTPWIYFGSFDFVKLNRKSTT